MQKWNDNMPVLQIGATIKGSAIKQHPLVLEYTPIVYSNLREILSDLMDILFALLLLLLLLY